VVLHDPKPGHNMMIEEMNLSGTGITIRSLRALAPVISLSGRYLRDMDISSNGLHIVSDQDVMDWEIFLEAFRDCRNMKRLVLSQNDFSGQLALETMARVYSRHPPLEPDSILPQSLLPVNSDDVVHLNGNGNKIKQPSLDSLIHSEISTKFYGLRCIPYIVLQDVHINMHGALWLSYIIEHHPEPEKLMGYVKPGPLITALEGYKRTRCSGIVYKPNHDLSNKAEDLLDLAEMQRSLYQSHVDPPAFVST
jgi:hypothetical protein